VTPEQWQSIFLAALGAANAGLTLLNQRGLRQVRKRQTAVMDDAAATRDAVENDDTGEVTAAGLMALREEMHAGMSSVRQNLGREIGGLRKALWNQDTQISTIRETTLTRAEVAAALDTTAVPLPDQDRPHEGTLSREDVNALLATMRGRHVSKERSFAP
jgi:hypothetical protein